MSKSKLVIVGGVAAGASAAAKARRCSEEAEIIMFEKGRDISYATCGLPYYLSGVISKRRDLLVTRAVMFRKRFNVDVRTGQEVVKIDRAAQKISVVDHKAGREYEESYDRLVLATGSDPVIPSIPGIDKKFVFTMKTLDDTDRIYDFINAGQPKTAVIIGGGLIGMEMAENFAHLGIEVAVVEFMPQILTFLDREMAEIVTFHAQQKGVDFYLSEKVVRLDLDEESGQGYVETDQGRKLAADVVITSVGIRPNTRLAKEAGLEIGTTGGVGRGLHGE